MIGCTDDCLALAQWLVVSQQSIELVTAGAKQREAKQSRAKKSKTELSSRALKTEQSKEEQSRVKQQSKLETEQSSHRYGSVASAPVCFVGQLICRCPCCSSYQIISPLSIICLLFKAGTYQTSRCADVRTGPQFDKQQHQLYVCFLLNGTDLSCQEHFKLSMFSV